MPLKISTGMLPKRDTRANPFHIAKNLKLLTQEYGNYARLKGLEPAITKHVRSFFKIAGKEPSNEAVRNAVSKILVIPYREYERLTEYDPRFEGGAFHDSFSEKPIVISEKNFSDSRKAREAIMHELGHEFGNYPASEIPTTAIGWRDLKFSGSPTFAKAAQDLKEWYAKNETRIAGDGDFGRLRLESYLNGGKAGFAAARLQKTHSNEASDRFLRLLLTEPHFDWKQIMALRKKAIEQTGKAK